MRALRRWLGMACLLLAACCATVAKAEADQQDSSRQILVLTALPAPHFRLGSTYGGGYRDGAARLPQRRLARRIARDYGLVLADDWPLTLLGLDCFVMTVPEGRSVEEAAQQVSRDRSVSFAEPMRIYAVQGTPISYDDPLLPAQPASPAWRLQSLHQLSTGRGVRIAVIDSGIEASHPDLAGQLAVNQNFVAGRLMAAERHGTAVAGVIAAKAGNGIGVVGVAPNARLLGLRACWQAAGPGPALCDTLSLAKALHYAIDHKAQVINMSLAGPRAELLDRLLAIALSQRIDVVAAFDPSRSDGGFPASRRGVVAVAEGAAPAGVYAAQGKDVITTQVGGRWNAVSGSSYAAAQVSGLLALAKARGGTDAAHVLVARHSDGGEIDACATLLHITGPCDCACARESKAAARASR